MKEVEKNCLEKLLTTIKLETGVQYKKEIRIVEESIIESTMDIWSEKSKFFPELSQYEVYKCFILKFELAFGGFINPNVDLFHYTLKSISYSDKVNQVDGDNIRSFFENGMIIDKYTSNEFIKKVIYEDGSW